MKNLLLLNLSLLALTCASANVYAQAVESVPLAPMEIKPIEARPLDGVPQEDTPAPMDSAPLVQPETYQATQPIPSAVPYGSRMGTAPPEQMPVNKKFCSLKVSFESKGAGPDRKTGDKIKTYLDANADKLTYLTAISGKEGEYSYCIDIQSHKDRSKIYTAIKKLLPPAPSKNAPITLSGAGFTAVDNSEKVQD